MIQPILDDIVANNLANRKGHRDVDDELWITDSESDSFESPNTKHYLDDYTVEDICKIIKLAFVAAAEREITVGDGVQICIISKKGEKRIFYNLPTH